MSRAGLVMENRASKAIHLRIAPLAGPAAKEKLAKAARHTKFWLAGFAARTLYRVDVNRNGRFRSVCHKRYVGARTLMVKAQDAASAYCSF